MRLTPECEQELRKLCSLESKTLLAEVDALRAELSSINKEELTFSPLYKRFEESEKERDQLKAENSLLKYNSEGLDLAATKYFKENQKLRESVENALEQARCSDINLDNLAIQIPVLLTVPLWKVVKFQIGETIKALTGLKEGK